MVSRKPRHMAQSLVIDDIGRRAMPPRPGDNAVVFSRGGDAAAGLVIWKGE